MKDDTLGVAGTPETTGAADIVNRKCDCCGRMIPSKPYSKPVRGRLLRFCSRDCYELYLEYRLKAPTR